MGRRIAGSGVDLLLPFYTLGTWQSILRRVYVTSVQLEGSDGRASLNNIGGVNGRSGLPHEPPSSLRQGLLRTIRFAPLDEAAC